MTIIVTFWGSSKLKEKYLKSPLFKWALTSWLKFNFYKEECNVIEVLSFSSSIAKDPSALTLKVLNLGIIIYKTWGS